MCLLKDLRIFKKTRGIIIFLHVQNIHKSTCFILLVDKVVLIVDLDESDSSKFQRNRSFRESFKEVLQRTVSVTKEDEKKVTNSILYRVSLYLTVPVV